ncbi:unnamed protein product [Didymodactylos carnosus]|uniref:Protein kinase domain-containing protein n=1 Tax=Didymodactylos carnosus TaxID=1234261 RepID=A0A8S2GE41_9BILA|nr:unnamed protein product [Didymodactylos carnosus]CAF3501596.1 unnamed protein product [Didymodactylos carnosus]
MAQRRPTTSTQIEKGSGLVDLSGVDRSTIPQSQQHSETVIDYPEANDETSVSSNATLRVTVYMNEVRGQRQELTFINREKIGQGTFGRVYRARIQQTNEICAIKEVEMEGHFKNRELEILRQVSHTNIINLKSYFNRADNGHDVLCLVLEFLPMSAYMLIRNYRKQNRRAPLLYTKIFCYQMLRALGYLHSLGIAHRDVKPSNMVLDYDAGVLKLCDLGSAKRLVKGERSVAYICSRYYRAPELLLGCIDYSVAIDAWSAGTVIAEFLNGYPIFRGDDSSDQMYKIIRIMGIPTRDDIVEMNPQYRGDVDLTGVRLQPRTLQGYLPTRTPIIAIDLCAQLLQYRPSSRITCMNALATSFFDELREQRLKLPNGKPLPPLFNFKNIEVTQGTALYNALMPAWINGEL